MICKISKLTLKNQEILHFIIVLFPLRKVLAFFHPKPFTPQEDLSDYLQSLLVNFDIFRLNTL